jgi:HSP20 family protein
MILDFDAPPLAAGVSVVSPADRFRRRNRGRRKLEDSTMLQVTRNQPVLAPMRDMFNSIADGLAGATVPGNMPVDIVELEDHYEIRASVPGFTAEQITIEVENGVLAIYTVRTDPEPTDQDTASCCGSECCMLRQERFTGSTSRQIRLPAEVDDATIVAGLENGVLTITLAKPVESAPRRIAIT